MGSLTFHIDHEADPDIDVTLTRRDLPNGMWEWMIRCPHGVTGMEVVAKLSDDAPDELPAEAFGVLKGLHSATEGCTCAVRIQPPAKA